MPYNWNRPGSDPPEPADPPVITTSTNGDIYVAFEGTWAILGQSGDIVWAVDETPLVTQGQDAYTAFETLFGLN